MKIIWQLKPHITCVKFEIWTIFFCLFGHNNNWTRDWSRLGSFRNKISFSHFLQETNNFASEKFDPFRLLGQKIRKTIFVGALKEMRTRKFAPEPEISWPLPLLTIHFLFTCNRQGSNIGKMVHNSLKVVSGQSFITSNGSHSISRLKITITSDSRLRKWKNVLSLVFFLLVNCPKGMETLATIGGYETLPWNNL